jgi:hypothetical protein
MDYLQKAKDYASMVAYSTKGDEYTFDETGLAYFLDSLNIDFLTEPPNKEWVGLTNDEVAAIYKESNIFNTPMYFAMAVEAKLKEKNGH